MRAPLVPRVRMPARCGRDGFTLMEVLVALVILGFVILSAQASVTSLMVRDVGWQERRARATQLAMDRLHAIQADPVYATLAANYTETGTEVADGYIRDTELQPTRFDNGTEYLTVTVTVTGPQLPQPVSRTTVIASP